MPTLNWIGKEAVVGHDKKVSFRLLRKVKANSVGENSQNLIMHGDNLEALKALMPYYVGKIKCIYIDPPYNTGNEKWVYNDKVNSPKIQKWIGKVVGSQSEDLNRHDKWLCMMYPRLRLLKDLLADDGSIFISIDDNEHCGLKHIMDEIFGDDNFVCNIIWQKKYTQSNDAKYFSATHDFIVCYAKNKENFKVNLLPRTEEQDARYKNIDNDPRGIWMTQPLHAKSGTDTKYEFIFSNGIKWCPPAGTFPRYSMETLRRADKEGKIWFGKNGTAVPRLKKYLNEMKQGVIPKTVWLYDEVGSNDEAKRDYKDLFPNNGFATPKPIRLLKRIVKLSTKSDDFILDSFAGSGTTGHAVLDLNKEDGGNRKFILVEMEDSIAKDITAERVKRAIEKYDYGNGFEYCELGKPLFDEDGQIEKDCDFGQFANYVYFTETQTNIDKKKIEGNFIGENNDVEYYLIYKEKNQNFLTEDFLKKVKKSKNKKIVYADKCMLSDAKLAKYNIQFKQIPYEVKVY